MKKILLGFVLMMVFALMSCDSLPIFSNISTSTDLISSTDQGTDYITTIIDNDIYLRLNPGQDTVEINTEWTDAGALFVLNNVLIEMTTEDEVDITSLGIYRVEYTYTYEEVIYSIMRYVVVTDQISPEIKLNLGIDTVIIGNEWTDAGVTISDNSDEAIGAVITGSVDINTPGRYQIIYTATDSSGNDNSVTRYVTVIEE